MQLPCLPFQPCFVPKHLLLQERLHKLLAGGIEHCESTGGDWDCSVCRDYEDEEGFFSGSGV